MQQENISFLIVYYCYYSRRGVGVYAAQETKPEPSSYPAQNSSSGPGTRANLQLLFNSVVTALEAELEPLRSANRESTSRLEGLSTENAMLRTQAETWRKRASDVKRLQLEKEQLHSEKKELQKLLDQAQIKTSTLQLEAQKTNAQLLAVQQRLQEENRKKKEELAKLQAEAEADATKAAMEQLNQAARLQELEERLAQLTAEAEQLRKENEAIWATEKANKNLFTEVYIKFSQYSSHLMDRETIVLFLFIFYR